MTRSNKVRKENRENPKGYGKFHAATASLLLDVYVIHLRRRSLSRVKLARIAAGAIIEMSSSVVHSAPIR